MALETVERCPACGSGDAEIAHAAVPDFVFAASDEQWTLMACRECQSLYLRERPDRASIGQYYRTYYTHSDGSRSANISGINVGSAVLRRLANSWRNFRYGTQRESLGVLGTFLMVVLQPLRRWIDAESRHLPSAKARRPGFRVLDIGCGDGRFVRFAGECGCASVGMEVDPVAVEAARASGLDVRLGDAQRAIEIFGIESFDYITLSHVIEHVFEPRETLRNLRQLLRPGGRAWIETPNPDSFGHTVFGDRWRDLDPPRHLCLLSEFALRNAAENAGLELVEKHYRPFVPFEVFPWSAAARAATDRKPVSGWRLRLMCALYEIRGRLRPSGQEWLTLTFRRSNS